jgi:hypothetical protein
MIVGVITYMPTLPIYAVVYRLPILDVILPILKKM